MCFLSSIYAANARCLLCFFLGHQGWDVVEGDSGALGWGHVFLESI